jgi:5,10-methylenetetrahydrofolate reductase
MVETAARHPVVVAGWAEPPLDRGALVAIARRLAGSVDALQLGDSNWARVQFPPAYRADVVASEGLHPWMGLNCRDRNRVALEGELAALANIGASVHCVTGDHPAIGHRPDASAVFDLDSPQLAALAAEHGLLVSVAESPLAPPMALRPGRLVEKVRAGAHACLVNHCAGTGPLRAFVREAQDAGAATTWFLASVPLVAGPASLAQLRAYPGVVIPPRFESAVDDGADLAVAEAAEALAIPGVVGVLLTCAPPTDEVDAALATTIEVADRIHTLRPARVA